MRTVTTSLALAIVVLGNVALVAMVAAAPFVVHDAIDGLVEPGLAAWISLAVGAVMLTALAAAWVQLRARRNP